MVPPPQKLSCGAWDAGSNKSCNLRKDGVSIPSSQPGVMNFSSRQSGALFWPLSFKSACSTEAPTLPFFLFENKFCCIAWLTWELLDCPVSASPGLGLKTFATTLNINYLRTLTHYEPGSWVEQTCP